MRQKNSTFLSWDKQTLGHTNSCEVERIAKQAWINVASHLDVVPQIFEFERYIPRQSQPETDGQYDFL